MAKASMTARGVATVRRRVDRVPFTGGDPRVDDRLGQALGLSIPLPLIGTSGAYFRERTRFFDQAVVDAIRAGIDQLVLIGAGYDGRAFRYRTPATRWFEVDHPATQADKRARLAAIGVDCSHVAFVPCDLAADDVGPALAAAGHDPSRSTLFLAEAVFPYLPVAAIERVLRATSERRGPSGRLAVELGLVPHDLRSRLNVGALRTMTSLLGERILTMQEPEVALDMLRRCGWAPRPPDPSFDRRAQGTLVLWLHAD
ncbi:MAG: SAM-dependent methyltransferase [Actinomycetota bacterium]|nr:SAM-dependent methyltransferase [Actinomycetota bacterium]